MFIFSQKLEKSLVDAAEAVQNSGEKLVSLQDASLDVPEVRSQMDALSNRVEVLKRRMAQFEEHYEKHMQKATEFQQAVERLLAKFTDRKEEIVKHDIDTSDSGAVSGRLQELEVTLVSLTFTG